MSAVRILERVIRPAPLGIRFRDVATGLPVTEGLVVTVTAAANPARRATLEVNRSGTYYAPRVPGLPDRPDPEGSPPQEIAFFDQAPKRYRIEASDPAGRFLPLAVDLDLPVRGLVDWPGWGGLPQAPLAPLTVIEDASPPVTHICRDALPLFSAPGRALPAPLAEIRLQLALAGTEAPAAWALVTASHAGRVRGIGQADAQGRAVLFFPYPDRPRPAVAMSPPQATEFAWATTINAYWDALAPERTPELAELMAQLDQPRDLFRSTLSPPELLPEQLLSFGRPLTLRTALTPEGPSSLLMMAAA